MIMSPEVIGLFVGFLGGCFRAIIGFVYKKARNPKMVFKPYLFLATLIEGIFAGIVLGSRIPVTTMALGVSVGLASAGFSELMGKTGLHDKLKK